MENKLRVLKIDIYKKKIDFSADKIVVNTFSDKNLMELAPLDTSCKKQHEQLIENDYMLYMHKECCSYFIKRKKIYTIWKRKDLIQFKDSFYTLEKPSSENLNECAPKRLIVLFSSLPNSDRYYSANIADRCFAANFALSFKSMLKNTIIMKIMDLNLTHGSSYLDTTNYPTFEDDVQQMIMNVAEENEIASDDIVLYGSYKGGTAALYHGYKGNYKVVSVSPTLTVDDDSRLADRYFFEKLKKGSIINNIIKIKEHSNKEKIIIGSPIDAIGYQEYKKLENEQTTVVPIFDSAIRNKFEINKNSTVEQETCINQLFLSSINLKRVNEKLMQLTKEINGNDHL